MILRAISYLAITLQLVFVQSIVHVKPNVLSRNKSFHL